MLGVIITITFFHCGTGVSMVCLVNLLSGLNSGSKTVPVRDHISDVPDVEKKC